MRCHWSSASSSLLLILLFFEPLSAQRGEFSLEQVMSAGFPSEMTAAPVGGAVAWVINERGRSPVLLIHGDDDRNVPFSETVDLVAALRKQGVEFEQLVFPDEVHGFLTHHSWIRAFQAAAEFLERRLMSTRHKVGDNPEQ